MKDERCFVKSNPIILPSSVTVGNLCFNGTELALFSVHPATHPNTHPPKHPPTQPSTRNSSEIAGIEQNLLYTISQSC